MPKRAHVGSTIRLLPIAEYREKREMGRGLSSLQKAILALAVLLLLASTAHAGVFRVVKIIDGDSVVISGHADIKIKVQLMGISAPNPGRAYAKQAKELLTSLLLNKNIEIAGSDSTVPDSKTWNVVFVVNELNINLQMVKAGLAQVYPNRAQTETVPVWAKTMISLAGVYMGVVHTDATIQLLSQLASAYREAPHREIKDKTKKRFDSGLYLEAQQAARATKLGMWSIDEVKK